MKRSSFITWDQLKVGAMIIVGLGILGVAIYKLGEATSLFSKRYELVALLPNASGLRVGGSVMVAGQLAGTVTDIEFLPVDNDTLHNLRLVVSVDRALQEQIRADSKARLRTMGLLGDKVFDISPGTPRYSVLQAGDTVPVEPTLDYEEVLGQAAGAVGDVVELTRDLRTITGGIVRGEGTVGQLVTNRGLYDQLVATLGRTNALLSRVQSSNGTIGRLLDDPSLYNQLTGMIASTDSLVSAVSRSDGTFGRLLQDTTLYVNLVGITQGADSLMKALTSGNGLASKLLTDQTLYDQLNKLVHDMNAILEDVRQNPQRYMKGLIQIKLF